MKPRIEKSRDETKKDIEELEFKMEVRLKELEAKIEKSRDETKKDIEISRAETEKYIAGIKEDIAQSRTVHIRWTVGILLAMMGALAAMIKL